MTVEITRRGGAEFSLEGGDEGARAVVAGVEGDRGHGRAVGERDQRVEQPGTLAPGAETHAGLGQEQACERARTGPGVARPSDERPAIGGLGQQRVGHAFEAWVPGLGQMQRRARQHTQFIQKHPQLRFTVLLFGDLVSKCDLDFVALNELLWKLAGELAIEASGCEHLIIRTSWVYSSHGSNFVLSMLALAERRLQLSVVDDQIGCPTWARNLARASVHLIHSGLEPSTVGKGNIYHYCDADQTCWYDFAQMVFNTAVELELLEAAPKLKPVSSGEYPQIATRPQFSVLDTGAIRASGFQPAGLPESLRTCMMDLKSE